MEKGGERRNEREERRKGVGEEGTVWKGWKVEETRCSPPDHYKGKGVGGPQWISQG